MDHQENAPGPFSLFIRAYFADRDAGNIRRLGQYLDLFPGARDEVTAEYIRLEGGDPAAARRTEMGAAEIFGPFELRRRLGQGAFGEVVLAYDRRLKREVALKRLHEHLLWDDAGIEHRFLAEARLVARLNHPGICPVYEVDVFAGRPFIAMKFLEGETLASILNPIAPRTDRWSKESPEFVRQILGLFQIVAEAVSHAHLAGVIHRDLKPSNIIVDATGHPTLLDFGLAHDLTHQSARLTGTKDRLGTVPYMAPETLDGSPRRPDARADVWAIGVMLYESLAGHRPFDGPTDVQTIWNIVHVEPPRLVTTKARASSEVQAVVEAALQKDPQRRYASADKLGLDLAAILAQRPVSVRPLGPLGRGLRYARRYPGQTLSGLAVALAIGVALFFVSRFLASAPERLRGEEFARLEEHRAHLQLLEVFSSTPVDLFIDNPERWNEVLHRTLNHPEVIERAEGLALYASLAHSVRLQGIPVGLCDFGNRFSEWRRSGAITPFTESVLRQIFGLDAPSELTATPDNRPRRSEEWEVYAHYLANSGRPREAADAAINAVHAAEVPRSGLYASAAQILLDSGDREGAVQLLERADTRHSANPSAFGQLGLLRARIAIIDNNIVAAEKLVLDWATQWHGNPGVARLLGELRIDYPVSVWTKLWMANLTRSFADSEIHLEFLRKCIVDYPQSPGLRGRLLQALLKAKREDEARALIASLPPSDQAYLWFHRAAVTVAKSDRIAESLRIALEAGVSRFPLDAQFLAERASVPGSWPHELPRTILAEAAVRLAPNWAPAFLNFGMVLNQAGNHAWAAAAYEYARKLRPSMTKAWSNGASLAASAGDRRTSELLYRRAVSIEPGHLPNRRAWMGSLLRTGQFEAALDDLLARHTEVVDERGRESLLSSIDDVRSLMVTSAELQAWIRGTSGPLPLLDRLRFADTANLIGSHELVLTWAEEATREKLREQDAGKWNSLLLEAILAAGAQIQRLGHREDSASARAVGDLYEKAYGWLGQLLDSAEAHLAGGATDVRDHLKTFSGDNWLQPLRNPTTLPESRQKEWQAAFERLTRLAKK